MTKQDMDNRSLALVEHFSSFQGEGKNAGRRAYFVRFAGCNLDCAFADGAVCDTPWQKAQVYPTIGEILDNLEEQDHDLVILTGGEPTIAKHFNALIQSIYWLRPSIDVAVESNGVKFVDILHSVDWYVVSPKEYIAHRRPVPRMKPCKEALLVADELRLVVTPDVPLDAYRDHDCFYKYVSPATISDGSGDTEFKGFVPGAVEHALKMMELYGWRMSLQTHKFAGVR